MNEGWDGALPVEVQLAGRPGDGATVLAFELEAATALPGAEHSQSSVPVT